MSVSGYFFLIKEEELPSLPLGVRRFVEGWFRKKPVFGIACWSATASNDPGTEADFSETGSTVFRDGRPVDEYDLDRYGEGLDLDAFPSGAASWLHSDEIEKYPGIFREWIMLMDD